MSKLKCKMCGLCCKLFLINLNKEEYYSSKYLTVFNDIEIIDDFKFASEYGANILKQKNDGSCIYLKNNICSIHEKRPEVCRNFFCMGTEDKYKEMRTIIEAAREIY